MKSKKVFLFVLCNLVITVFACSTSSTQNAPVAEVTLSQTVEATNTKAPTSTLQNTPIPTTTFTPMPLQQLTVTNYLDFIQSLPLSTITTDPDTVSGVIYNGYGVFKNTTIAISNSNCGENFAETKTDEQGHYTFPNIQAGTYYLTVYASTNNMFCGEEITKSTGIGLVKDIIIARNAQFIISPRGNQTVTEIRPTITWRAIAGAAFYTIGVNVQTSESSSQFLEAWLTNSTSFTFTHDLNPSRKYRITLTAYTLERLPLAEEVSIFQY